MIIHYVIIVYGIIVSAYIIDAVVPDMCKKNKMDDLIKALIILRKYDNPTYPTHCEHDVLYVDVSPELVSGSDKRKLSILGFKEGSNEYENGFISFRFGSC